MPSGHLSPSGHLGPDHLEALVTAPESARVERKASVGDLDRLREAICAFANDLDGSGEPGVLAIGVDDDGRPTGIAVDDRLLTTLAHLRDDGAILPVPAMRVEVVPVDGIDVVVVLVEPSPNPPVKVRGRTWVRVGPRRALASNEEELRLAERRRAGTLPFDVQPLLGASVDDLALDRFVQQVLPQLVRPEAIEQNHRSVEQQLRALRFLDRDGHPTPTGLLVCGRAPTDHLPGAYVQFVAFEGATLASAVTSAHAVHGVVQDVIPAAEELVRLHIDTAVDFAGRERERRTAVVPIEAAQQVIRNAVMHRTYEASNAPVRVAWFEDRLEIRSPGGPYGQVTVDRFGEPGLTDYRNPTLAATLAAMGFVQRFGVGIEIARSALAANGNPPPEFRVSPTSVEVTLRWAS